MGWPETALLRSCLVSKNLKDVQGDLVMKTWGGIGEEESFQMRELRCAKDPNEA